MLKEYFLLYQQNIQDNQSFIKLTDALKPKILSIFKTIRCPYSYKELFIQDCHIKIIDVAIKKKFREDTTNDLMISAYFERAFKTVKQKFIKEYEIYHKNYSLDETDEYGLALIDKIAGKETIYQEKSQSEFIKKIKLNIAKKDFEFMMSFMDLKNDEKRSVTEVAKLLNVSHQAVSKRIRRVKKIIKGVID